MSTLRSRPAAAARVVIFGASSGGLRAWEALAGLHTIEVVAFLDNDESRRRAPLCGLPVLAPAELDPAAVDGVVIGSMHVDAIVDQLVALGVPATRIHTPASLAAMPHRTASRAARTVRPKTLNFQVNDVCNARCVMCAVWTNKRDRELSPGEFGALLSDPYFSELEHIGITGGEPTLRRDLPAFYVAAADACRKLTGASFITHGMDRTRAVASYTRVAGEYRARGLAFHGMVSLDGVGEVHDRVRGRSGAFERATETLFALADAGIPTMACCTIVRANVWGLRDLFEWSRGRTHVRFRVAEFIDRLGNAHATDQIRAFDDAERAELISFFQMLIQSYEPDETVRKTYASIVSVLAGGPRLIGCPYQDGRAVNLDCRGNVSACAPRGRSHALASGAGGAAATMERERIGIRARYCPSCIHDYHDEWRPEVLQARAVAATVERRLAQEALSAAHPRTFENGGSGEAGVGRSPSGARRSSRVLVLGWYGTETIGDLAILAGLAADYARADPHTQFIVPSFFPDYTRHNLARTGLDAVCRVASYGDAELIGDFWKCDTVIFGGGPLMDVPHLAWLASIFDRARARGCRTIVDGCGVGPVNRVGTVQSIRRIAEAAGTIRLRDRASAERLRALGVDRAVEVVEDPAARWVRSTGIRHRGSQEGPICVFARELTDEYPQPTPPEAATALVAAFLQRLCDWFPDRTIRLHAMHHFPVGGDDRLYAKRLVTMVDRPACSVDAVPRTPLETLDIMAGASFVVCMRFHSLVFASGIGAPFVAIDYTNGGKVADFLRERGLGERGVSFAGLEAVNRRRLLELGAPDEEPVR